MKIRILNRSTYKDSGFTNGGLTKLYNDDNYYIDSSDNFVSAESSGIELFCFGKFSVIGGNTAGMSVNLSGKEILNRLIEINEPKQLLDCIQGSFRYRYLRFHKYHY